MKREKFERLRQHFTISDHRINQIPITLTLNQIDCDSDRRLTVSKMNPKDSAKNEDRDQMKIGSESINVDVEGTGTPSERPLAVNEHYIDMEFVGDIKSDEMEQEQHPQSNGM